jgi:PAS domain S-box-containing protein
MKTEDLTSKEDWKRIEDLKTQLEFYRTICDSTYDWELLWDTKGKILYCSPSFERFTGYKASDLITQKVTYETFIHPEDLHIFTEGIQQILASKAFTYLPFRILHKQETIYHVEAAIKPIYQQSKHMGFRVSVRDVSASEEMKESLIKSEATLQTILQNSKVGIAILNNQFKYVYVNNEWCHLFGSNLEEVIGRGPSDFTHPKDKSVSNKKLEQLLNKEIDSYRLEKRFMRKDGTLFWGDLSVSAIEEQGNITRIVGIISDITQWKESLEKIKKFSVAVEQSPAAILITDLDGNIEYVNTKFCNITGYSEDEALGQNPRILKSGYHSPEYYKDLWDTISSGKPWKGELYNRHKNGTYFWEEAVISPIVDEQNNILNYIAIKQDISEKKRIQQQLNKSEENLKEAQKIANVGHWEYDIKNDKLSWSDQTYRIYGVSPNSFTPTFEKMAQLIHPDDAHRVKKLYFKSLRNKTKLKTTFRIFTQDNNIRYVVQRVTTSFANNGEPLRSLGAIHDITEQKSTEIALKRNETLFRSIFNTSPAGITIFNEDGIVLLTNQSSQKIHGFNAKEKIGKPFYLALHPSSIHPIKQKVDEAFSGATTYFEKEIKFMHKDGHVVWVNSVGSLLPEKIDGKKAIIVVNQDISRMKANKQKLIELNATKDKFFGIIAHDLKNPFNSILGVSEVLLKEIDNLDNDEIKELTSAIYSSGQNAYSLLENLLQWSSSQTGRISFDPEPIILNDVVREVVNLIKGTATHKEVSIKCQIPEQTHIEADKNMLQTILRNLITNATKFTPRGGEIIISAKRPNGYTQIRISDNGVGMTQEAMKKLFRIDHKNSETGTENEKGSGLGLILCKEFVEKHKGSIWVQSSPGKGSTFSFTIPDKQNS